MFCANCGTKNDDGAVFCAGCGQKLESAPAQMAPASEVAAPAPAPVEFNGLEDEATVAAYFNPATGMTTPIAPAPVTPVAPEVVAQPVAPAPEVAVQPVAPTPVAPVQPAAPAPEVYAQPVAPTPVAPAQPVAPTPVAPGQPVAPAPAAPAAPKEKKGGKIGIIIGIIAAVVVVALIAIVAIAFGGKSGGAKITADWNAYYSVEDEITYVVYGDKVFKDTIDGDAWISCYSMDQTVIVLYNEDGEYFLATSNGKITSIGDEITDVNISADGSTVAYIDDDDALISYQVSNGKTSKIAEDVYSVVLSPSGKSLAYVIEDDDDYKLYVYNGKKETELSKNARPVALTDDCNYIYYYDTNKDALYVTNLKDDSNKIAEDVDDYILNKDHTEIMFTTDSGLYVSIKGGDKEKISGKSYIPYYVGLYTDQVYYVDIESGAYTYNLKSFKGNYYVCGDSIIYIDKKWSSDKVVNNVDDCEIADDLKTVYFVNDNETLYSVKLDGKYETTKIKSDVTSFDIVKDGSAVYFIVDGDSLYYQKGKGDSTKIATDVHRMRVSYDGIAFFTVDYDSDDETGTLYYSKGGKDKQKVASDVYGFACKTNTTVYYDNYEYESSYDDDTWSYSYSYQYDVNLAKSGTKFSKILEAVGYKYSY